MNMTTKENLLLVKQDIMSRTCVEIHLIWSDGKKAGIGNPHAIQVAIDALIAELDKQIANC